MMLLVVVAVAGGGGDGTANTIIIPNLRVKKLMHKRLFNVLPRVT